MRKNKKATEPFCSRAAKLKPPMTAEAKRKISAAHAKRPKKLSSWIHKLDAIFSIYIRTKYADHTDHVRCFTCEQTKPIKEMDCGHFVGRQHKSTRWLEENNHPQCRYCNRYNEGRKDVYAVRLVEKYGPGILSKLQTEKAKIFHLNPVWVEEAYHEWRAKYATLLAERSAIDRAYKELEPTEEQMISEYQEKLRALV
jgi:hypothetical protein